MIWKNKIFKRIAIVLIIFSSIIVLSGMLSATIKGQSVLSQGAQQKDTTSVVAMSQDTTELTISETQTTSTSTDIDKQFTDVISTLTNSMGKIKLINVLRGLLGLVVIIFLCWIFSANRKAVKWRYVLTALLFQVVLALGIIYVPFFAKFFEYVGKAFIYISLSAEQGTKFLFGNLVDHQSLGYIFAFKILPTIIFFSAITSLLFYWGIIQVVVKGLGKVFSKLLGLSGVESLSLAGNIFLGQTEAPLVVKAYLPKITDPELFMVMVGGMATMAGGVLAAYITLLGGTDIAAQVIFAKHLLAASVMAAPAAVVTSRILMPPVDTIEYNIKLDSGNKKTNVLDVISNGATEGMKLAVNIAAMLLVFIALIALSNYILGFIGDITHLNNVITANTPYKSLSLEFLLGYAFSPVMWLLGVPLSDIMYLGQLLGEKTILNEFVGYSSLKGMINAGVLQPKSIIMAVYLLCGFANFGSIGIQIGGIGLLAPNKQGLLAKFGVRALFAASTTALLSAIIMGMLMG